MVARKFCIIAAAIAALPLTSNATIVTWRYEGVITEANPAGTLASLLPDFADVAVGEQFEVFLSFDTDATLLRTRSGPFFNPGVKYEYDPASISYLVRIGTRTPLELAWTAGGSDTLFARDNSGDVPNEAPAVDGYTFGIDSANGHINISTIMRGPVLDIVTSPLLPTIPDPRLADLALSRFLLFSSDGTGAITGDITSITTPVPLTLIQILPVDFR